MTFCIRGAVITQTLPRGRWRGSAWCCQVHESLYAAAEALVFYAKDSLWKADHTRSEWGREEMTERQQCVMQNFDFLKQHIKRKSILRSTLRSVVPQSLP